ncbi:MAG: MATE family efflux transporter, partial [Spirochaetia bacterium]|nr:MATE family efflux transporter [Spirochaetia bacterium]
VLGNAYFILILNLGVVGAGLATLLSRIIGSVIILVLIANQGNIICIRNYKHLAFRWNMIKRILTVGIPNGIEGSVFQIGKLLVQGFIAAFGTPSIAANAIAGAVSSFANIPGGAIGLASITIVGQAVGAKKPEQAIHYAKKLLLIAYISMFIVALPIFLFAPSLVRIFNLSAEASLLGANVIRTAMVFGCLFWPTAFALPNFLRAAGDAKYTMLVSMLSMWIFRVGASYILAVVYKMGIYGVWFGMYLDWMVRSTCFVMRFIRGKWKTKRVI